LGFSFFGGLKKIINFGILQMRMRLDARIT